MTAPRLDGPDSGVGMHAQLDLLDTVAAEFFGAPSDAVLQRWRTLLAHLPERVDDAEFRARLTAHRALSAAISSRELGDPDARSTWAARLASNECSGSQARALVQGLAMMLMSALTLVRPVHR